MELLVAFKTGSLIAPVQYQSGASGKVFGTPIGELYTHDNVSAMKVSAEYIGTTQGQGDFVVTYASGNMVALSGLPYTPSDENIFFVSRIPVTGSAETYTKRFDDIRYWTNTIQVTSASFASTDHFIVGLYGQKKAYDSVLNANQVVVLNAEQIDIVDYQTATGSVIFDTDSEWLSGSVWNNVKGYNTARIWVEYGFSGALHAGANTLYVKTLQTYNTTVSSEFDDLQLSLGSGLSSAQQNVFEFTPRIWRIQNQDAINTTASYHGYKVYRSYYDVDVLGSSGLKFAISESIGAGSTTGTLNIYYTLTTR